MSEVKDTVTLLLFCPACTRCTGRSGKCVCWHRKRRPSTSAADHPQSWQTSSTWKSELHRRCCRVSLIQHAAWSTYYGKPDTSSRSHLLTMGQMKLAYNSQANHSPRIQIVSLGRLLAVSLVVMEGAAPRVRDLERRETSPSPRNVIGSLIGIWKGDMASKEGLSRVLSLLGNRKCDDHKLLTLKKYLAPPA